MTANHTPGPWVKDYGCTKGHIKAILNDGDHATPTVARYDIGVDKNHPLFDEKTMEANGRLIAAAPEMLAMLEDIDYCLDDPDTRRRDRTDLKRIIAKARGQE